MASAKRKVERQRRPNRQKTKRQITVRLDDDLLQIAKAHGESDDLSITDVLEKGLVAWLKTKPAVKPIVRVKFLWSEIPLDMQRRTLAFWSYLALPERPSQVEEIYRRALLELLDGFRESSDYQVGLGFLGAKDGQPSARDTA